MKILFVTYYWPPCGGVSAQRITHFVSELSKLGHECHVIIPENPSYYTIDETLLAAVHKNVVEHSVPIYDVTSLLKRFRKANNTGNVKSQDGKWSTRVLKWIRANVFIPDPKVLWLRPVLLECISLLKKESYDMVYTNGTPHSLHLVGLRLQEKYKLKWVADFRDPWTGIDFFEHLPLSRRAIKKHRELENEVITKADRVITVSPTWANQLSEIGNRDVKCITNGYDTIIQRQETDVFVIAHIGSLHADRDIGVIIEAMRNLSSEIDVKLQLVGSVDSILIKKLRSIDVSVNIEVIGEVAHYEAKSYMASASILLLPINQSRDSDGRIPAKLFEYLTTEIPILALGDREGDAAKIISEANVGVTYAYTETNEIMDFVSNVASGKYKTAPAKSVIGQYSRQYLSNQLAHLLLQLAEDNTHVAK